MSSAETNTPENQPTLSGDAGSRSRIVASLNQSNSMRAPRLVDSTIIQIEDELAQIDRIMHSWSDGRSLRFDPAHVKAANKTVDEKEAKAKLMTQNANSLFASLFSLNLIAMLLILTTVICEIGFGWLGSVTCIGILVGTSIAGATFNLLFVSQLQRIQVSRTATK